MKKSILSLVYASMLLTSVSYISAENVTSAPQAEVSQLSAHDICIKRMCASEKPTFKQSLQNALADTEAYLKAHKQGAIISVAAVVAIIAALKYCTWLRTMLGLESDDEESDEDLRYYNALLRR